MQLYQNMHLFICALILLFQTIHLKQLFITYSTQTESVELFKYFHSMHKQFYVDIGAYDPIYASNTANFLDWNGLNVQASMKRHSNFLVSRPHQINLNVAVTNITGGYVMLVQYAEDSAASIDQNYLKTNANPSVTPTKEKVQQITMAQLCHQYYPKRPKLMSIDIQGHGLVALRSNDWADVKCQPEVIIVEHIEDEDQNKEQRKFLEKNQYSFQSSSTLNEIYVHKSLLHDYLQRVQVGNQLLENMKVQYWFTIFQSMFKTIIPDFNTIFQNFRHIDPRTCQIYVHFASQRIVSIENLRATSLQLLNSVRPILILHYNPIISKLYLGSQQYTITQVKLVDKAEIVMHHIEVTYSNGKSSVYVLDHNIKAPNPLQILDKVYQQAVDCKEKYYTHTKVVNTDNYIGN